MGTQQPPLPTFEGLAIDAYDISFSGKVPLNRFIELDEQIIRKCQLGRTVRLTIEGFVVGRPHTFKPADEDDEDSEDEVMSGHKIKVLSVSLAEGKPRVQTISASETGEICGEVHRGYIEPCALLKSVCDLPPGLGAATGVSWTGYS